MSWASAWRLAVGTLTVIPVRPPDVVDRTVAGRAMALAPLAVLPLAVVAAGLGWLAGRTGWPPLLAGLVVVAVLALGTRALHLDGLADTVDGLGSGRDRERGLEIMRRGDVGPMGVIALLLVLGGQAAAASVLVADADGGCAADRPDRRLARRPADRLSAGVPAARPGGLGAAVAGSVTPLRAGRQLGADGSGRRGARGAGRAWPGGSGSWPVLLGAAVAYGVVRLAVRRLGGITGDVLGATVELHAAGACC